MAEADEGLAGTFTAVFTGTALLLACIFALLVLSALVDYFLELGNGSTVLGSIYKVIAGSSTADSPPTLVDSGLVTVSSIGFIWSVVGLNFLVLAVLRPLQEQWHPLSVLVGYAGLMLQAVSFYRVRYTDPGTVTDEWLAAAAAGKVPASVCPRSGKLVPPRGLFVRRAGESVILGFDHYCFWIGAPIGLRNRRHFIHFTMWTAVMAIVASAHLVYELGVALPARLRLHETMVALAAGPETLSAWRRRGLQLLTEPSAMAGWSAQEAEDWQQLFGPEWVAVPFIWGMELCAAAYTQRRLRYLTLLLLALAVDAVSAVVMGYQVLWHLHLVLTGRTSLADDDDSYDAGRRKNWEHVFGTTRLWPLPLKAGGPTCDGFTWPECEGDRKRE